MGVVSVQSNASERLTSVPPPDPEVTGEAYFEPQAHPCYSRCVECVQPWVFSSLVLADTSLRGERVVGGAERSASQAF